MIAFTFPGQGSQTPAMGQPWRAHPSWAMVEEASDIAGRDVAHLLLHADADELVQTDNSQIATFVLSMVILDAVERLGVEPTVVAGHSLGEYSALVASGALAFVDGVSLVAARGSAMATAATDHAGTMAAVLGLDDDLVEIACARTLGDVWVANYNGPGQVVIAGSPAAVDAAGTLAIELGARRIVALAVSGAFHTPYMAGADGALRAAVAAARLREADVPVITNVDASARTTAPELASALVAQLSEPVRWRRALHAMADMGVGTFIELGPGSVLTGIARRTIGHATTTAVAEPDHLDRLLEIVAGAMTISTVALDGGHLFTTERLVVSPGGGVYQHATGTAEGTTIAIGDVLGEVGSAEVRSPFAGTVMGLLAVNGERVTDQQPILWLQSA